MQEIHKGKYYFGEAKIGEKGQVVIPKEARDLFKLKTGDTILFLGDEKKGIAIVRTDAFKEFWLKIFGTSVLS